MLFKRLARKSSKDFTGNFVHFLIGIFKFYKKILWKALQGAR